MQSLIDFMGSIFFGGAMLSIILSAHDIANENQSVYNGDLLVQEMLVQTSYLVEGEFRNMGVGVPDDGQIVFAADTSAISFLYDIDRNGVPDTIAYTMGTTADMAGTQNPRDRPLFRRVNGGTSARVGVVTTFHLRYLTRTGDLMATPVPAGSLSEVHSVEITMEVQNPYAVLSSGGEVAGTTDNALYSNTLWQQTRLASQNSRR
jgi:hypothetical protein